MKHVIYNKWLSFFVANVLQQGIISTKKRNIGSGKILYKEKRISEGKSEKK
jgi:hypothetical protein